MPETPTRRDRVRIETRAEILSIAERQLSSRGAAALSLRAIARELGVVSSAIYRYFPSRDVLLTELIMSSYRSLGEHAEQAEATVARGDYRGRLAATLNATREWAHANRDRYALIYGSPIPGYFAPPDTVEPASLVGMLLVRIGSDAFDAGLRPRSTAASRAAAPALDAFAVSATGSSEFAEILVVGVDVWTRLFGVISAELFGHLIGVVEDVDAYFAYVIDNLATNMGL